MLSQIDTYGGSYGIRELVLRGILHETDRELQELRLAVVGRGLTPPDIGDVSLWRIAWYHYADPTGLQNVKST